LTQAVDGASHRPFAAMAHGQALADSMQKQHCGFKAGSTYSPSSTPGSAFCAEACTKPCKR